MARSKSPPPLPKRPEGWRPSNRREQSPDNPDRSRRADSPSRAPDATTDAKGKGVGSKLKQLFTGGDVEDDDASQSSNAQAKPHERGRPDARDPAGRNERVPRTTHEGRSTERDRSRARGAPDMDNGTVKGSKRYYAANPPLDEDTKEGKKHGLGKLFTGKNDKPDSVYGTEAEENRKDRGKDSVRDATGSGRAPARDAGAELPPDYPGDQRTMKDRGGRRDLDPKSNPPLRKGRGGERRGGEGQGRDVNDTGRRGQQTYRDAHHGRVPDPAHVSDEEYDRHPSTRDNRQQAQYNEREQGHRRPGHVGRTYEPLFAEHEQGPPCEECDQPLPLCGTCHQLLPPHIVRDRWKQQRRI